MRDPQAIQSILQQAIQGRGGPSFAGPQGPPQPSFGPQGPGGVDLEAGGQMLPPELLQMLQEAGISVEQFMAMLQQNPQGV